MRRAELMTSTALVQASADDAQARSIPFTALWLLAAASTLPAGTVRTHPTRPQRDPGPRGPQVMGFARGYGGFTKTVSSEHNH